MEDPKEQKKLLKAQKKAEKQAKLEAKKNAPPPTPNTKSKKPTSGGYDPTEVEKYWTEYWLNNQIFIPEEKDKKFCICIPPPNITGSLHIGHSMMISIEDSIVRYKRLTGHEVLYLPGLDHAGIATQSIVMKSLANKQVNRDEFLKAAFDWSDKYGDRIYEQFNRMGTSLDYSRKVFTLDKKVSKSVTKAFCELYNKGLVYRDTKIVNWCGKLHTTLSDLEVNYKNIEGGTYLEVDGGRYKFGILYYIKYYLSLSKEIDTNNINKLPYVVIATTRPETILGDSAICINPDDKRFNDINKIFESGKVEDLFNEEYKSAFMTEEVDVVADTKTVNNQDNEEFKAERKNKYKTIKKVEEKVTHKGVTLYAINPLTYEVIPVIFDEQADLKFGTGILKITPYHDAIDFKLGKKHNLSFNRISDENNKITHSMYLGMPRFEARKAVVEELKRRDMFVKEENHSQILPFCSRSNDLIEAMVKEQWWCDCKEMSQKALKAVKTGDIQIFPEEAKHIWFRWLENDKDWCLSRQLWWGHRIPAFKATSSTSSEEEWIVAETEEEAYKIAVSKGYNKIQQDDDVLDTWFSSGLWPFSTLGWPEKTIDFDKYFPNSLLETGSDILFFWVARMVMLSFELIGKKPFDKILLHGIVRDAHGRKMSKSLGNVIDPIYVIDGIGLPEMIENLQKGNLDQREIRRAGDALKKDYPNGIPKCGADALRFTLLNCTNGMNDLNLDILRVQGYSRLCNKIYNAFKFVKMTIDAIPISDQLSNLSISNTELKDHQKWILDKLNRLIENEHRCFETFNFMEATKLIYQFFYDFCDNIIEVSKKPSPADASLLKYVFNAILKIFNPFMPFITEDCHFKLNNSLITDYPAIVSGDFANDFNSVIELAKICRANEGVKVKTFDGIEYLSSLVKTPFEIVNDLDEYETIGSLCYKIN